MKLLAIGKGERYHYILVALLAAFIILPVEIPHQLASLVDTPLGKVVIVVLAINLLLTHPVVGVVGIIAAYVLVRRSGGSIGLPSSQSLRSLRSLRKLIPSERQKSSNLNRLNQFPLTVEEIVIHNQIPYSFNLHSPGAPPSYKPVQDALHSASRV